MCVKSLLCIDLGPRTHQIPLDRTGSQRFRANFSGGRKEAYTRRLKTVLFIAGSRLGMVS